MIESNLSFGICMYQFSIWNELTYKISRNVVGCHQRICLAVLVYHSHAICGKLWIEITHVWCRTIWIWTTIFSMLTKRPDWSVLVHRMLMADGKSIAHYYHRRSVDGFRWRRNDGVTTTASAFFFVAQQTNRRKRVIQLELSTPPKPDTFVRFIFCFLLLFLLLQAYFRCSHSDFVSLRRARRFIFCSSAFMQDWKECIKRTNLE